MISDYILKRKDDQDIAADKIREKFANTIGVNDFYQMGAIDIVDRLIGCYKEETDTLTKNELIIVLEAYRDADYISNEISGYVKTVLKKYNK